MAARGPGPSSAPTDAPARDSAPRRSDTIKVLPGGGADAIDQAAPELGGKAPVHVARRRREAVPGIRRPAYDCPTLAPPRRPGHFPVGHRLAPLGPCHLEGSVAQHLLAGDREGPVEALVDDQGGQ